MTEQPDDGLLYIEIQKAQCAKAIAIYHATPEAVDKVLEALSRMYPGQDRITAEDHARRVAMSACLCHVLELTPEADAKLFRNPTWQELLGRLLLAHDQTDIEGTDGNE